MEDFLLQVGMIQSAKLENNSLISIDSRNLVVGQIFFALPGANTHGDNFVLTAAAKGASAAVVSKLVPNCPITQIVVPDTFSCLLDFAKEWRSTLEPHCFGVTGSNGKTSVRAMVQHVLEKLNIPVCASMGNNNNDLGASISVLKLREKHSHAVFELGARGCSQIEQLAGIVKHNIGILTNISECHLEGFGGIDDIVKAKSELFSSMDAGGAAVINIDSYGSRDCIAESEHLKVLTYGYGKESADFGFDEVVHNHNNTKFSLYHCGSKMLIELKVSGDHNVYNAVAAIAALSTTGIDPNDISHAIASFTGVDRRLASHTTPYGMFVIDDSYNASPASFDHALRQLGRHVSKNKWLVCGDMAELGIKSEMLHMQLIEKIKQYDFSNLVFFGDKMHAAAKKSKVNDAYYANTIDELKVLIGKQSKPGDAVLIKGSRCMQLDKLVDYLLMESVE